MSIKAIETRYKGYRFRSRLEARWAVFFDALGLRWEYEPEGFDLGDAGLYLPDFRLTFPAGKSVYCEVKGAPLSRIWLEPGSVDGVETAKEFARQSGEILYILSDPPETPTPCAVVCSNGAQHKPVDPFGWLVEFYGIDVARACRAARSARFEHGQKGAI